MGSWSQLGKGLYWCIINSGVDWVGPDIVGYGIVECATVIKADAVVIVLVSGGWMTGPWDCSGVSEVGDTIWTITEVPGGSGVAADGWPL